MIRKNEKDISLVDGNGTTYYFHCPNFKDNG